MDYGLLASPNHILRAFNPFLIPLFNYDSLLFACIGLLAALFQSRAYTPFALIILLTLNYEAANKLTYYGSITFAFFNILYFFYALIKGGLLFA